VGLLYRFVCAMNIVISFLVDFVDIIVKSI